MESEKRSKAMQRRVARRQPEGNRVMKISIAAALLLVAAAPWSTPAIAVTCDLTMSGGSCAPKGTLYQQQDGQPTTSDQLSFVRMAGPSPAVEGYGAIHRPMPFAAIIDPARTAEVFFSSLPAAAGDNSLYPQLGPGIYRALNTGGYSVRWAGSGTKAHDLDGALAADWVKMDYLLHHGSGSSEAWLFAPAALLADLSHVWFAGNFADKEGHEEWLVTSVISEPPVAWLLALGLLGMALTRAPRKACRRRGVRSSCYTGRSLA
jgi:hypothetical protein